MALRHLCKEKEIRDDNAMAENIFSILKTECIHRRKPTLPRPMG